MVSVLLEDQIKARRREISTDRYSMSIGELTRLYQDGELIVHPEFQRFFRWDTEQKSRLVESILLGIPLPSFFVAQIEGGVWELVDGLQRVSTLLELQGELKDETGKAKPQLVLEGTKYLPALDGKVWQDEDPNSTLSSAQKLDIKRSRIDVQIVERESSTDAKYDLFQRLNSYGSQLTAQELRSCLLVSVNPAFLAWVERLAKYDAFTQTVQLSERLVSEQYDIELVLRFVTLYNEPDLSQKRLKGFSQKLDDAAVSMASRDEGTWAQTETIFEETFSFLAAQCGEDTFRKWDAARGDFTGSFLNTAYEVFAMGAAYNLWDKGEVRPDLLAAIKEFWSMPGMQKSFATGMATEQRMSKYMPRGRELLEQLI